MLLKWEQKFDTLEQVNEAEASLAELLSSFTRNNKGVSAQMYVHINEIKKEYIITTKVLDLGAASN